MKVLLRSSRARWLWRGGATLVVVQLLVAGCAVCAGCGGSANSTVSGGSAMSTVASTTPAQSSGDQPTTRQSTGVTRERDEMRRSSPTGASTTVQSVPSNEAQPSVGGMPPSDDSNGQISSTDAIGLWTQRLALAEQQLQSSGTACRDICRASSDVCAASRELCALTGDREGAPATDPRCARARASCDRASRQRENACPVCSD
jgi:hypothetical protein